MRTSDPDFSPGTLNPYVVKPQEVQDRDRYGYKIIAVISGPFWCAYRGGTGWDDEKVASEGDAIREEVAKALFPSLGHLIYSE
jgi:hypothetical protein